MTVVTETIRKRASRPANPGPLSPSGTRSGQTAETSARRIYGDTRAAGVSVEWHDFTPAREFEWSRLFHEGSLELCLNLTGCGSLRSGSRSLEFGPMTAGFYLPGANALKASRAGGQRHRFLAVEFSREFLREQLAQCDGALHPLVEEFVRDGAGMEKAGEIRRLTAGQERLIHQIVQPPTVQAARSLWQRSQVLQLMVEFFFERPDADELFCDRQKRLARERVGRTIALLRENLCDPPNLEKIGRLVGCSPFYLSRTFSRETGMTLPQYLRKLRMERAAELLRSGKFNVTEAATEVGYSSLSHFSQAFCQTMGCCPALYPVNGES